MTAIAPVFCNVFNKNSAPKTIHKTDTVIPMPCSTDAITRLADISQTKNANKAVVAKTTGIAFLAGQCRPTSNLAVRIIGTSANKPKVNSVIF